MNGSGTATVASSLNGMTPPHSTYVLGFQVVRLRKLPDTTPPDEHRNSPMRHGPSVGALRERTLGIVRTQGREPGVRMWPSLPDLSSTTRGCWVA